MVTLCIHSAFLLLPAAVAAALGALTALQLQLHCINCMRSSGRVGLHWWLSVDLRSDRLAGRSV
jgi:hypothetical protein